ncbi:uncharacterized protein CANTADRAFT_5241 [Suhomyces tanzawaensis NRRL Y-17324]|uniref:Telomere length regulation protein conserved domain-containing protein n=1 Tax=Suhomyces tanzawaensis NRRL Y-17324 TaxID=984487 RepID=A0A1E4SP80_9ASCO|nr:uncharacterized protein CANTADRAFT_5241 [Suhomyces tanzawaensis NRRL Y-17324]ODV81288.1 hypothetical protein CANTADRAFT_5241 [Suhomyces tanzawaensis NRRL Y-17324]
MDHQELRLLEQKPSIPEIESTLKRYSILPFSTKLVTILLNNTIPETYHALPPSVKALITSYLQCLEGVGNLLAKIASFQTLSIESKPLLQLYFDELIHVFDGSLITRLVSPSTSSVQSKEIDKLLFKGKTFSICAEIFSKFDLNTENTIFASSDAYLGFLSHCILSLYRNESNLTIVNLYIHSIKSFNSSGLNHYFNLIFNEANWVYFTKSFNIMKSFEKKELLTQFFTKFLNTYVRSNLSDQSMNGLFEILEFTHKNFNQRLIDQIISCLNTSLNLLLAMILTRQTDIELYSLAKKLISNWGDDYTIKAEPIVIQKSRTEFLIYLFSFKQGSQFLEKIMGDKVFLDAVSTRLLSNSNSVKELGILLANQVCEYSGKEKIFKDHQADIDLNIRDVSIVSPNQSPWAAVNAPTVEEPGMEQINNGNLQKAISRLSVTKSVTYTSDSDDEDEDYDDEDPTIGPRVKVSRPIYIKDLLEYLNADSKNPNAYEMIRSALKHGPTLIRQKGNFGNELVHFSEDLMSTIIGLNNQFEDKDFESAKLNFMIAIIVANPDVTLHLFKLLLVGDYSLQQRMVILSAASLSVRELKGFKDSAVASSFKPLQFPSKMLPENVHRKFQEYSLSTQSITSGLQDELMQEQSQNAQEKIHGGKVIRISSGLRKKTTADKPKIAGFYKLVGSRFFFPLISVWYEAGEIDIGPYTPIFIGHYLSTLTLILHSAYPSALNLNEMVREMLLVVELLVKRVKLDEVQLVESIITSMMLICDIMDGHYLITTYGDFIFLVQKWLENSWERMIDERLKSLSAGLLLRLSQLSEKFERTLMDQVNGFQEY